MITLSDTFNNVTISRHRTVRAAVSAQRKHIKAVQKANGANSYITYRIASEDGAEISEEVWAENERQADGGR